MTLALWVYGVGVVVTLIGASWLADLAGVESPQTGGPDFIATFWPVMLPILALCWAMDRLFEIGKRQANIPQNNK